MNYPSKLCVWLKDILQRKLLKSIVDVGYMPCDKRSVDPGENIIRHRYTISLVSRELDPTAMLRELCDWLSRGAMFSPEQLEPALLNWVHETYPVLRDLDIRVMIDTPGRRIEDLYDRGVIFRDDVRSRFFARVTDDLSSENAAARELVEKQRPENGDEMADSLYKKVEELSGSLQSAIAQREIYNSSRFIALEVVRRNAKYADEWPTVWAYGRGSYEGQVFPYENPLAYAHWKLFDREFYAQFNLHTQNIVIHERAFLDTCHSGCPIERGDWIRVIYFGQREAVVIEHKTYREYREASGGISPEVTAEMQMYRERTVCSSSPNDMTTLLAAKEKQVTKEMARLFPRTSTIDQRLIEISERQKVRSSQDINHTEDLPQESDVDLEEQRLIREDIAADDILLASATVESAGDTPAESDKRYRLDNV